MLVTRLLGHPWIRGVWIGLVCAGIVAVVLRFPIARGLDDWLFDGCFAARQEFFGPRPSPNRDQIVIITLDERDFDALEKPIVFMSPELAAVISHARASGASAVGVDMMIPNSLSTVEAIIDSRKFGKATEVGKAVRNAGGVVLPVSFPQPPWKDRWPVDQWLLKYRDPDARDPLDRDMGSIDMAEDADRFVRRATVVRKDREGALYPGFALALAAWEKDEPWRWDGATHIAYLGDTAIPVSPDGTMTINWVGPPGTFAQIPFREVLAKARAGTPMSVFQGKIALIGTTDPAYQDLHPTPFSNGYADFRPSEHGRMAGVEIHANAIATILDAAFVTTPPWLSRLPWLFGVGALLGWIYTRVGLTAGFLVALAHHFGWKLVATLALTDYSYRLDLVGMLLLGVLTYGVAFANRWRVLRRVLSAVKSSALAKALEDNPSRLDLLGENRLVTVMFVDIRGFSTFSSKFRDKPARIVELLNAYFSAVIPGIERQGGTINQFMGDGMMILFNAPVKYRDHAAQAVRAAIGMLRDIQANQAKFTELGLPDLRIGVGINSGFCTVGAVGAKSRLDYSAIGDVTNAAARLEAATKEVGAPILIGPGTYECLTDDEKKQFALPEKSIPLQLKGVGELNVWPIRVE